MNIQDLGAIGDLISGIAVIASLIYVGVQIRQSIRTDRARAFQDIFASFTAHSDEMFGPDNLATVVAGMRDFGALSGEDRLRFDHLMVGYLNALESAIFYKNSFLLGSETMDNWAFVFRTRLLPYPGVRAWWSESRLIFARETRDWVESMLATTDTDSDFYGIKDRPI